MFLADVFVSIFMVLNNTAIQLLIPDSVRGRVMSLLMMSFGLTPLGTLPMSWFADQYGAPAAVALASVCMMVIAVLFFLLEPVAAGLDLNTREAMEEFEREPSERRARELTPAAK